MSRVGLDVPFGTAAITGICVLLEIVAAIVGLGSGDGGSARMLSAVALDPGGVLLRGEAWRLLTTALFHAGLFHLTMNMLSHISLGSGLERRLGTARFLCVSLLIALCSSVMYVIVCLVLSRIGNRSFWLHYSSVGFSGVLFGYAAIESFLPAAAPTRSVFGLFEVPTKWYPWVLMVILQVMLPNVSLLGHLTGLLTGTLYSIGGLHCFVPSRARVAKLEQGCGSVCVACLPNYCKSPTTDDMFSSDQCPRIQRDIFGFLCGGGTAYRERGLVSNSSTNRQLSENHQWPESSGHVLGGGDDINVPIDGGRHGERQTLANEATVVVDVDGSNDSDNGKDMEDVPLLDSG